MEREATGIHQFQTMELEKPPKPIPINRKIMDIKTKAAGITNTSFLNRERLNFRLSAFKYISSIKLHAPF